MNRRNKKKNRNNGRNNGQVPPLKSPPNVKTIVEAAAEDIQLVYDLAMENATEDDIESIPETQESVSGVDVIALAKLAKESLALLEAQRKRSKQAEDNAEAVRLGLEEESAQLEAIRSACTSEMEAVENTKNSLESLRASLEEKETELLRRHEEILKREIEAEASFAERNRLSLRDLERESENLRKQFAEHRASISRERAELEEELRRRRSELDSEINARRDDILSEVGEIRSQSLEDIGASRAELDKERASLRKLKREIDTEKELLTEDRAAFEDKVEKIAAYRIEELQYKLAAVEERLKSAREEVSRLEAKASEREESDRRFGNKSPDEIYRELKSLQSERLQLRKALEARPGTVPVEQLYSLQQDREQWEADRARLLQENVELKSLLQRYQIQVTELETLRDQKASLEVSRELLQTTLGELREEVKQCAELAQSVSPFPSCSAMDTDDELQKRIRVADDTLDLEGFSETVRHRIAFDPSPDKKLYYSARDIRCFIGGLATSRLHLLQGISGTGKTSLPQAFARAINGGCVVIEVQAGWRDRQDLIGHYNSFEKRFYESKFLQALYQAQCPRFDNIPFIVVLDEMNLSHPEQYFADFLSSLELGRHLQRIDLMTFSAPNPPSLLQHGRTLSIPSNVWFVGTANHDETTRDFAPKTYDRAHVMELPRHRESFEPKEVDVTSVVSYTALATAFEKAQKRRAKDAATCYHFLESRLSEDLGKRFRIGWGNRLQRQVNAYVPVVITCGGTLGEATDHLLTTKLLRKLRDRHDNRPEDLIKLRDNIRQAWGDLDHQQDPKELSAISLLHDELHRLGVEEG